MCVLIRPDFVDYYFITEIGSKRGDSLLEDIPVKNATKSEINNADQKVEEAVQTLD